VYLFYEECRKRELDQQKLEAIIMANAMFYAQPSYDRSAATKKQQNWKKFIDSFEWEKKNRERKKQTVGDVKRLFSSFGVPIPTINKKKKKDDE